eukprot:765215-Hanusia_phi.AAC.1
MPSFSSSYAIRRPSALPRTGAVAAEHSDELQVAAMEVQGVIWVGLLPDRIVPNLGQALDQLGVDDRVLAGRLVGDLVIPVDAPVRRRGLGMQWLPLYLFNLDRAGLNGLCL